VDRHRRPEREREATSSIRAAWPSKVTESPASSPRTTWIVSRMPGASRGVLRRVSSIGARAQDEPVSDRVANEAAAMAIEAALRPWMPAIPVPAWIERVGRSHRGRTPEGLRTRGLGGEDLPGPTALGLRGDGREIARRDREPVSQRLAGQAVSTRLRPHGARPCTLLKRPVASRTVSGASRLPSHVHLLDSRAGTRIHHGPTAACRWAQAART
jgi:hypothetical protein